MLKRGDEVGRYFQERFGSVNNLMRKLHTSAVKGIKTFPKALEHRENVFGKNYTPLEPFSIWSVWKFLKSAVLDWIMIILNVVAVISIILGVVFPEKCEGREKFAVAWYEGVGILVTVVVMIILAALADFLHDRDVRCTQEKIHAERRVAVIRDAIAEEILSKDVRVGDLCKLKAGSIVPADGIVVHQSDKLQMDETALGTLQPVFKNSGADQPQLLFAGSHVVEGVAKMVVLSVGENTIIKQRRPTFKPIREGGSTVLANTGSVRINIESSGLRSTKQRDVASSLQGRINRLNHYLGLISLAVAVVTFLVIIIRFSIHTYSDLGLEFDASHVNEYVRAIIMAVVVIILVLPEGLPLVLNISIAFCIKRLNENKCLVRHADIIENMGNITVICCNKTGILTENRMAVSKCYIAGQLNEGDPRSYKGNIPSRVYDDLIKGIALNTSYAAAVRVRFSPSDPSLCLQLTQLYTRGHSIETSVW